MDLVIFFKYKDIITPLIKIKEIKKKKEVIIVFIPFQGEHISLHKQKDGTLLRTHWSKNKPKSTWDDTKVEVAKVLGYNDPERHGKYYIHSPLLKISNVKGYHLTGRRIILKQLDKDAVNKYTTSKYKKYKKIFVGVPFEEFMLNLYLSTTENKRSGKNKIPTFLGDIVLVFNRVRQQKMVN